MLLIATIVSWAIQAYIFMIFIWVLGSWFPQWQSQSWYRLVSDFVEPYMRIYRPLPLRIGMIDLTPMAAIFVLIIIQRLMEAAARGGA